MPPAEVTAPLRTDEERAAALARAMEVRQFRAALREELRTRRLTGEQVLDGADVNPQWGALPAAWLLKAVPGVGPVRAERIMERIGISPSRRLRGLGHRQRAELRAELSAR